MTDETLQSIIIKSDWQAYEEGGIQIGFGSKKDNSACQEIFKYCPTPSPGNVLWSDTIYTWLSRDTVPDRIFPGKCEPLVLSLPHMDAISFCWTSRKWVLVARGEWKHAFWDWVGSSWQELTKQPQGQSSWLCWYGSKTGQHKAVPNSPWQNYESHEGCPSVIYLHVFKFITHVHALHIPFELHRQCRQRW